MYTVQSWAEIATLEELHIVSREIYKSFCASYTYLFSRIDKNFRTTFVSEIPLCMEKAWDVDRFRARA